MILERLISLFAYTMIAQLTFSCIALADLPLTKLAFYKGEYNEVLKLTQETETTDADFAALQALRIRAYLETGRYKEAKDQAVSATERWRRDTELELAALEAYRANGQIHYAQVYIDRVLGLHPRPFSIVKKPIYHGEMLLEAGIDAKFVLTKYFEQVKKLDPDNRDVYSAIGRLALKKHDRKLAAENYREGLKRFPNTPEFLLGLHLSGVRLAEGKQNPDEGILSYLDLALKKRATFPAALIEKARVAVYNREFSEAEKLLAKVFEVNPAHPEAWSLKSVVAFLEDDLVKAEEANQKAIQFWPNNPAVPHLIGRTLSDQRRRLEGISILKDALTKDPESPSILFDLGTNQIRFGEYAEGWKNIEKAHELDPFSVAAYNLVKLRDKIKGYPILEKDGVQVRMSPEDSMIFGEYALNVAVTSKNTLAKKYGISLSQPVLVEMLPEQEDFAIRTFGLLGGESFLGVCFGPLITMTSPRGRLGRANWESVLWHEMAHTITIEATNQRIPRWLTEGISVYEERQVREGRGQGMVAKYRERFIKEDMPEIVNLNESFKGSDILFGYYHSSLVVDYFIQTYGMGEMRNLLSDIKDGKSAEEALVMRSGLGIEELELNFRKYAKKLALAYGEKLDWALLTDEEYLIYREDPEVWVKKHPARYSGMVGLLAKYVEDERWEEVKLLAMKIIAEEPNNRESYNPYRVLAKANRALSDEEAERSALVELLRLDADNAEAAGRLLYLSKNIGVSQRRKHATLVLETNPFMEQAYRVLNEVAIEAGEKEKAISSLRSLIGLKPLDVSRLHYLLADQLKESSPVEAKREVLKSLETNPRFEPALQLLSKLPLSK